MKHTILATSLTLIGSAALLAADPGQKTESRVSVTTTATSNTPTGKVTVTSVDANGKEETHEIEIGNGNSVIVHPEEKKAAKAERKPWLGVICNEPSEEVRAQLPIEPGIGLLVESVIAGSPASQAGLAKADVIVKFDDQLLTNAPQLKALVGTKKEGDTVRLTYFRKGQQATLEAKIGMHDGGDFDSLQTKLRELMPGAARGYEWVKNFAPNLDIYSKGVVVDGKGNVLTEKRGPELDATFSKLEATLRDAGVGKEAIEQTRRALKETAETIHKAAGDADQIREQVSKELKKAIDQTARAVEKARDEAARARADAERANPSK